jgi:hypothetical protein
MWVLYGRHVVGAVAVAHLHAAGGCSVSVFLFMSIYGVAVSCAANANRQQRHVLASPSRTFATTYMIALEARG